MFYIQHTPLFIEMDFGMKFSQIRAVASSSGDGDLPIRDVCGRSQLARDGNVICCELLSSDILPR